MAAQQVCATEQCRRRLEASLCHEGRGAQRQLSRAEARNGSSAGVRHDAAELGKHTATGEGG
eukprot:352982-Chlamydomonas_euryale.AAC.1